MEIIQNGDWVLIIDLNGGRIRELKYQNEIVLGTYKRIDGKTGNTHICCPNFGSEGMEKFNLPFHGPFRNLDWKLIDKNENKIEIEIENLDFKISQIFEINDVFKQTIRIKNLVNEDRLINMAIHNYWDAKNGWKGTKLNDKIIDTLIETDSNQILSNINVLEIPGKQKYKWSLIGFKYGQFWTSFKESNEGKIYDQNYVCVEPSLEKQGFLDEGMINLLGLKPLEFAQTIEFLDK